MMEINWSWDEFLTIYQAFLVYSAEQLVKRQAELPQDHPIHGFRGHVRAMIDFIPQLKEELDLPDGVTKWASHHTLCFGFPGKKTHVGVWYDYKSALFEVYVTEPDAYLNENYDHERAYVLADQVIPTIQRTLERIRKDGKYA